MHVVVAGSHGLIGTALVEHLLGGGHRVQRLVRGPARGADEISWDPSRDVLPTSVLEGADAVVNLGGAGVGDRRWTTAYRSTIVTSRTRPTSLLARTLAAMAPTGDGPRILLQGSAVGFYGDRGDEELTEGSPGGSGFLADVVRAWEASTEPAASAGVRVARLRTGIVLSRTGGSFGRLLPLLRLGVGGPLGSGDNVWPWITLVDEVRAIEHLLDREVDGPVNLVGPAPVPQGELVRAIAAELGRPAALAVPRLALRAALGPFADEILASQRVVPSVLHASGFTFTHPDVRSAARWVTGT
ncbi:TIGR01777 family oxidoreductase [Cellulomonas carbonis]|uniref:Epimerase n=1 Tax=Cellulomonas carbonis T26 TaxID=947969 RepID=A0A0A0BPK2_9CELL|nr:TIGR01777 family oxidoreductase [Cellulomonas carbonis]KGM09856.1 epimerase [Cellulomonas carbonis T26]GGB92844.1 epimerase [Cellulomonas carbonis]